MKPGVYLLALALGAPLSAQEPAPSAPASTTASVLANAQPQVLSIVPWQPPKYRQMAKILDWQPPSPAPLPLEREQFLQQRHMQQAWQRPRSQAPQE